MSTLDLSRSWARQVLAVARPTGHRDGVHVGGHRHRAGDAGQPQRIASESGVRTERQSGQLAVFGGRAHVVEQPGRDVQIGDRERAQRIAVLLGHDGEIHMGAAYFGSEQPQKARFRGMGDRRRINGDRSRVQRRANPGDGVVLGEPGPLCRGELILFVRQPEVHCQRLSQS